MQLPVTPAWSKRAPEKVAVVWQSPQRFDEGGWLEGLPGAVLPLWQLEQFSPTPEWSNLAPAQLTVLWQDAQLLEAGGCAAGLAVAETLLWQATQGPVTLR